MRLNQLFFLIILAFSVSCTEQNDTSVHNSRTQSADSIQFELPKLPEKVSLFNSTITLSDFDVKERLDKELIVNTYFHSSTIQAIKRSNRYFPQIEKILKEYQIPDDFKYLCLIESGLTQAVSPSGAKGFWQFMPQTAKEYNLKITREIDERLHIEKSTRAACQYLIDAQTQFNDWTLTAASYNMGIGGVKNALKNQIADDYFDLYLNSETSRYVFRIMAMKIIIENQAEYGFFVTEKYDPIQTQEIKVSESIPNLMVWAKQNKTNYKMVKRLNPWVLGTKLTVKEGSSLILSIYKK